MKMSPASTSISGQVDRSEERVMSDELRYMVRELIYVKFGGYYKAQECMEAILAIPELAVLLRLKKLAESRNGLRLAVVDDRARMDAAPPDLSLHRWQGYEQCKGVMCKAGFVQEVTE